MKYSIVIPVYNSAAIVSETIKRTVAFMQESDWSYELILVNDGSRDESWTILHDHARANPNIIAINLLKNYGQHTAVYCGLEQSTGQYVITLDDDLQNPPEEIVHLVDSAENGHDVVYGYYKQKRHSLYRRLGSILIDAINQRIFHKPADIRLTNFRLMQREVVDRIVNHRTQYPYINGLSIMYAANPANVLVEHRARAVGKSQYNLYRIIQLVMRILFNYSAWPLRIVSMTGMVVSALSFLLGIAVIIRRLLDRVQVSGWASMVVLLAFFNGLSLLVLGMLGEYVVRLLNEFSQGQSYHIKEIVNA
jgi:glycosyltransferase involved in cell wall biosynthesis